MTQELLLVVDIQNDFMPGGALAVPEGDTIVPLVNHLAARFPHIVLTQDWHPKGHFSFAASHPGRLPFETVTAAYGPQVLWPDHCVQGTPGAEFHRDLAIPHAELVIRKGYNAGVDSYSAFREADGRPTGLAELGGGVPSVEIGRGVERLDRDAGVGATFVLGHHPMLRAAAEAPIVERSEQEPEKRSGAGDVSTAGAARPAARRRGRRPC